MQWNRRLELLVTDNILTQCIGLKVKCSTVLIIGAADRYQRTVSLSLIEVFILLHDNAQRSSHLKGGIAVPIEETDIGIGILLHKLNTVSGCVPDTDSPAPPP